MARVYKIILIVIGFISISAFTSYVVSEVNYEKSNLSDLSFERRLIYHDSEMYALENYYESILKDKTVIRDYKSLITDFEEAVFKQKALMTRKSITFEEIRKNPNIISGNFSITLTQYKKVMNIISTTYPLASPELKESLTVLKKYVNLANKVNNYTKLEMYKDATGDDLSDISARMTGKLKTKGLQSNEAVRKLEDLLKNDVAKSEKGKLSIYPNPLGENSKISFYNDFRGTVKYIIYDLNGRKITSKIDNVKSGYAVIETMSIINKNSLPKGIYILKIEMTNNIISNKFIVN